MKQFRNLVLKRSALLAITGVVLLFPFSPTASKGFALGFVASMLVVAGRIQSLGLASKLQIGIKSVLFYWGLTRWAVYAAVFYIACAFLEGGRSAGIMGVAGGLLLPLAVVAVTGATDADLEETAD